MAEALAQWILWMLGSTPGWVKVAVLSLAPVTEYKLAIVLGIQALHLSALETYLAATLGSVAVFFPLYFGLEVVRNFLVKHLPRLVYPLDHFLTEVERKTKHHYEAYGAVVLFVFAALPIPLTGVWSASAAAVIFKIPFKLAGPSIIIGALVGQLIVLLLTLFVR